MSQSDLKRLDVILRARGAASRKETRELVLASRITVNGLPARSASEPVPENAQICIDGAILPSLEPITIMLYKPAGYVSVAGEALYPSVYSLLRPEHSSSALFCIGRLDVDTTGLLLLTNDGDLSERIARPEQALPKTYYVECDRPIPPEAEHLLAAGIVLKDGTAFRPARLERCSDRSCLLTVTEGKYHEVKRLIRACGPIVASLKRVSIGGLCLDPSLKEGEYKVLTHSDICQIFSL